jgi:hypothetical protein
MANIKNLLVYISPTKQFEGECPLLAKVQIDNAISLGLQDDLMLVTNFPYEYNGVKSILVGDENWCECRPRSIKTSIIPKLIDLGILKEGEVYWNHDFDAYQVEPITVEELELDGVDVGFTDYGWKERWCLGSDFIKVSAKDIFEWMRDLIYANKEDETALGILTRRNTHNINSRIKKLNITYQVGMRQVDYNYSIATKPIKVLHFHPSRRGLLDIFMYGKSVVDKPLMTPRLINIFNKHGIK